VPVGIARRRNGFSRHSSAPVVHLRQNEYQETETFIAPINRTTPPTVPEKAIEIRQATKKCLGLDKETSWVITTDSYLDVEI
jgi:hypothetical protein